MKIKKMVVTYEDGTEVTHEGIGHVTVPRANAAKGKPYTRTVTATIVLPAKDVKGA